MVREFDELVPFQQKLYFAVGMFDGVHLGHQAVIASAVRSAKQGGGIAGTLTFRPHPSRLFHPEHPKPLILTPEIQAHKLTQLGMELVIQKTFDRSLAAVSAEGFITLLKNKLPTLEALYVGENFRFGKGRLGDVAFLVEKGTLLGITVLSMVAIKCRGLPISSTWIREALQQGRIEEANQLLGYPYFSHGTLTPGEQRGRRIGFPTLNIPWCPELKPRYGVYGVRIIAPASLAGKVGVANYGVRPTVGTNENPLLEIHLFEEPPPLGPHDTHLTVEWLIFIREEQTFPSLTALQKQIGRDKAAVQRRLK